MKKTILPILIGAALLLRACTVRTPAPTSVAQTTAVASEAPSAAPTVSAASPSPVATAGTNAMRALLPPDQGFQWQYFGTAEYAHSMKLTAIEGTGDDITYRAEGKVADMSGGAAGGDFSISISYRITPGLIVQQIAGDKLMDSIFPTLELIRAPLAKGTAWTQQQTDAEEHDRTIDCKITDIRQVDNRLVYTVEYRAEDSDYYERREITEGIGVTYFEKYLPLNNPDDKFSYQLFTEENKPIVLNYEKWLPQLGMEYRYTGMADYTHTGRLIKLSGVDGQDVYEYGGAMIDGKGDSHPFTLQYFVDTDRGTVTEKVVSTDTDKLEVHSKLHNLVVLKFPLTADASWSHEATLDGKTVNVQAKVIAYDAEKGLVQVRYTATSADGYYNNTYREERTFEEGFGMTAFSMLLPGDIGISAADAKDAKKLEQALDAFSFTYSMQKPDAQ